MKNLNLLLLGLLLFLSPGLFAQTIPYDQEYALAKTDLENMDYSRAKQRFKALISRDPANEKAPYVAFYSGVATYKLDDLEGAKSIFQELIKNHKEWNKLTEAQLWLAKVYFELNNPVQGVYYSELAAQNIALQDEVKSLKKVSYVSLDSVALKSILQRNTLDTLAAEYLAAWQVRAPKRWQNTALLDSLITTYQLDSTALGLTAKAPVSILLRV